VKKRLFRVVPAALLIAGMAAATLAQEAPQHRRPARHRFPLCLHVLDLTEEQRTQVRAILDAARPELQADQAAIVAAREVLRAALDAEPPDACAIGEAAIGVDDALQALREDWEAVKAQIAALLTPEQLAKFEGCLEAPFSDAPISDLGLAGRSGDAEIVR
jgi:Spy/CpxP family protein refolding chaperone